MIRDLEFFIVESLIGIRRSGLMIFITVATVTISLVTLGIFLMITINMNNLADFVSNKLEIRVYLSDTLSDSDIQKLVREVSQIDAVKLVEFIDKKTAWEKFKTNYQTVNISDILQSNPLPNSLRIKLKDNSRIGEVSRYLAAMTERVTDVSDGGVMSTRIELFSRILKVGGIVLVGILTAATLLIVVNTIRLTVIARQDEIVIMQLVGATDSFIRWPFIFEGFFIGVLGSVVSIGVLKYTYGLLAAKLQYLLPFLPLVFDSYRLNMIYLFVGVVGITLGSVGAYLSVSRSLKSC